MKTALLNIFSDGSNKDIDYTKTLGAIAFVVFLGISGYAYGYKLQAFNPLEWCSAVGVLLAATGGVSKIKDQSGNEQRTE